MAPCRINAPARMAESADAAASKAVVRKDVRVQVPLRARILNNIPAGQTVAPQCETTRSVVCGHKWSQLLRWSAFDHGYLLGRDGTTEGTPAAGLSVLDPVLSRLPGEARTGHSSNDSQPALPEAGITRVIAPGTSKRYGRITAPQGSFKQAQRGDPWIPGIGTICGTRSDLNVGP
jgi:hypothetical protein